MVWGWLVAFFFTIMVSASLAEIAGAYPVSGSVFHWSGLLTPNSDNAIASYICGWMSFLCNSASDASFAYGNAVFLLAAISADGGHVSLSQFETVGLAIGFLTIWTLINFLKIDKIGWINKVGVLIAISSLIVTITLILVDAPSKNSTHHVFFHYESYASTKSKTLVILMSILLPVFSFAGYDGSAYLAEETQKSAEILPFAMMSVTIVNGIIGFAYIVSLLYVTTSIRDAYNAYCHEPIINVFLLSTGFNIGNFLLWLLIFNIFIGGVSSVTISGRITFALLRDDCLPFSSFWSKLDETTKAPIRAYILLYLFDLLLLFIPLLNITAFDSLVGISTIAYSLSYAIPILIKVLYHRVNFENNNVSLGRYSTFVNILALFWLFSTSIILCIPRKYPVTLANFNWTPVVLLGFTFLFMLHWFIYAQYHFKGPEIFLNKDRFRNNEEFRLLVNNNDRLPSIDEEYSPPHTFTPFSKGNRYFHDSDEENEGSKSLSKTETKD